MNPAQLQTRVGYSESIQRLLLGFAMLTCSFEIFLILNIGFNFKPSQIAIFIAAVLAMIELVAERSKLRLPSHIGLLAFALTLSILFWPNSGMPERSVGYSLWFAFDILGVLLFFNLFKTTRQLVSIVRTTLVATCFNAWFGLFQFGLGIIGVTPPLLTQWWIEGRLPRINGFNYEPSFFATYLTLGWILSVYLWEKKSPLIGNRLIIVTAVSSSIALILCSSRMGWFAVLLWLARPLYQMTSGIIRRGKLAKNQVRLLSIYAILLCSLVGGVLSTYSIQDLGFILNGLGVIEGQGNYSAEERSETSKATGRIAANHALIGVGLGGIPSEIAKLSGATITTLEDAKEFEGKNITFELIAGLGLLGAFCVYAFFGLTLRRSLILSKQLLLPSHFGTAEAKFLSICLRGITWALVLELLLLQFNQNFLRAYTWAFVGLLFAVLRVASTKPAAIQPDNGAQRILNAAL